MNADDMKNLVPSDYETIILCLEHEHTRIVELLNSGKVKEERQDRVLRDRDYKIEQILERLGVAP